MILFFAYLGPDHVLSTIFREKEVYIKLKNLMNVNCVVKYGRIPVRLTRCRLLSMAVRMAEQVV
jgi:hypothetical protein